MGFNVVPAHPERKHPAGAWKGLATPGCRRVDAEDIHAGLWVLGQYPDHALPAFLFPSSHPDHPLVVVDVDDMRWLDTAIQTFGDTPIQVRTRRGVHLYYRGDPKTKVTSRSWLYGERSVDVKAWGAGVMAPGSPRIDGGLYEPNVSLDRWPLVLNDAPLFSVEAYEATWTEHRPKARAVARANAKANPKAYLHVVKGEPVTTDGGLELMGDISGDTVVTHERTMESMPISEVPPGDKVFAFDREDGHASGQVWTAPGGQRWYTDHTLGTLWRVLTEDNLQWFTAPDQRDPDPKPTGDFARDCHGLGVEVVELADEGYIHDQVPDAPGLTIVKAPHGVGKTVHAAKLIDSARSAISVANTAALAEHNAARFNITCYQEHDDETSTKFSTTINSLTKLKVDRAEVFHVDEADQVHAYFHSGTMRNPVENMHAMLDGLAEADRAVVSSADLTFEDVAFYVAAYRTRNPSGHVRVFVREPSAGRRSVRLVPLARAKAEFDEAFMAFEPGDYPLALGWTARRDVANLAWGYANRRPDVDTRVFWVSGENSRWHEVIERFRGRWCDRLKHTADFLDAADVFIFSPALQSGVSLESTVQRVFILHTKPDFETETVAQMVMRFRDVQDTTIVWGVAGFTRRHVRTDDRYLDGVCAGLADETDRQLAQALPEFEGEFPTMRPTDDEFAWSWRITQRKLRRSYADALGRARDVIKAHNWTLVDETNDDTDDDDQRAFNVTKAVAAAARDDAVAEAIAAAPAIDDEEARRIDTAHIHRGDDKQRLERHRIADFYGLDEVTVDDVRRDAKGKFRGRCRMFAWLLFRAAGELGLEEGTALAFYDWKRSKGRQPSEYRHVYQRATLLFQLHRAVFGRPFGREDWEDPDDVHHDLVRNAVMDFMEEHADHWSELFGTRSQPGIVRHPTKAVSWFGTQMKRAGAVVTRHGRNGEHCYQYDFNEPYRWSRVFRATVLNQYKQERERDQWAKTIQAIREHQARM